MIKIEQIKERSRCDNCHRIMELILKYTLTSQGCDFNDINMYLCEDCSNAISNLHHKAITTNDNYKYEKDEIIKII